MFQKFKEILSSTYKLGQTESKALNIHRTQSATSKLCITFLAWWLTFSRHSTNIRSLPPSLSHHLLYHLYNACSLFRVLLKLFSHIWNALSFSSLPRQITVTILTPAKVPHLPQVPIYSPSFQNFSSYSSCYQRIMLTFILSA